MWWQRIRIRARPPRRRPRGNSFTNDYATFHLRPPGMVRLPLRSSRLPWSRVAPARPVQLRAGPRSGPGRERRDRARRAAPGRDPAARAGSTPRAWPNCSTIRDLTDHERRASVGSGGELGGQAPEDAGRGRPSVVRGAVCGAACRRRSSAAARWSARSGSASCRSPRRWLHDSMSSSAVTASRSSTHDDGHRCLTPSLVGDREDGDLDRRRGGRR